MKIAKMSKEMFEFLQSARAIRQRGVNYMIGDALIIVDGKRKGLEIKLESKQ
jgi:hypothetical protein